MFELHSDGFAGVKVVSVCAGGAFLTALRDTTLKKSELFSGELPPAEKHAVERDAVWHGIAQMDAEYWLVRPVGDWRTRGILLKSDDTQATLSDALELQRHPRLLATAADIERVRGLIKRDELAQVLYQRLVTVESPAGGLAGAAADGRSSARRVVDCALLYRITGNATWATYGIAEITAQANAQTTWPNEESEYLNWGDTVHGLAIGYDWLWSSMSTQQRSSVAKALNRSLGVYAEATCSDPGVWYQTKDNWNAVVNGAAVMAALALSDEYPVESASTMRIAIAGLKLAMGTIGRDGSWPEGQVYTQYAAVSLAHVAAALETATGSSAALPHMDRLHKIGGFLLHQNAPSGHFYDYADTDEPPATADSYGHSVLMHLAHRTGNGAWGFAARSLATAYNSTLDPHWLRYFNELLFLSEGTQADLDAVSTDALFGGYDVGMLRSAWLRNASFLGFKGGTNLDPGIYRFKNNSFGHSHLDQGSFVLESGGQRFAVDLGSDSYELPGYFGGGRFDYYRLNSLGHNVLTVANQSQRLGTRAQVSYFSPLDASHGCCSASPSVECKCTTINMSESYRGVHVQRGFGVVRAHDNVAATFVVTDEIRRSTSRWAAPVSGHCLGGAPTLEELHDVSIDDCKAHCQAQPTCNGVSYSTSLSRCNVEAGAVVVSNSKWDTYQFLRPLPVQNQSFVWRMHTYAEATPSADGSSVALSMGDQTLAVAIAPAPMTLCSNAGARLRFVVEAVNLPAGRHPTDGLRRLLLRATGNCSRITVISAPGAPAGNTGTALQLLQVGDWVTRGMLLNSDGTQAMHDV